MRPAGPNTALGTVVLLCTPTDGVVARDRLPPSGLRRPEATPPVRVLGSQLTVLFRRFDALRPIAAKLALVPGRRRRSTRLP
jgi:hypothetical protein